jgi:hypothetical protein
MRVVRRIDGLDKKVGDQRVAGIGRMQPIEAQDSEQIA